MASQDPNAETQKTQSSAKKLITKRCGAGGMGEVYRATDTRLGRTVAIKVLPSHLSADPQFQQRFEREAQTISHLSHPHICTLYDIGHENGIDFLVMEYLDGKVRIQFNRFFRCGSCFGHSLIWLHQAVFAAH